MSNSDESDVLMSKKLKFSETVLIIYEDPSLSLALQEARTSDLLQRQADKYRYEKLLNPIFDEKHRLIAKFRQLSLDLWDYQKQNITLPLKVGFVNIMSAEHLIYILLIILSIPSVIGAICIIITETERCNCSKEKADKIIQMI